MDTLIGRELVKVERLGWYQAGQLDDLNAGPVHLVLEGGHGIFLAGMSDWSLELVETGPADGAWLEAYNYDCSGSRWLLRDASSESPFAAVIAKPLFELEPMRNEVDEVIGLNLNFGGQTLTLQTWEGEATT
jgi:hypothetical protein